MQQEKVLETLQNTVLTAAENGQALQICGAGSKSFYGRNVSAQPCDITPYSGIIAHEPSELVITARAGTPLRELEQTLAAARQILPFEPPYFSDDATIGGVVACGLSGPRRAYAGALRDFVLGIKCINGKGEVLTFGGQVMKNVAGYDLSRLMTGAQGTLGIILEVSLKLLPQAQTEITLTQEVDRSRALALLRDWAGKPLPLSASAHLDNRLYYRLSGVESSLQAARAIMGGDELHGGEQFWEDLREQRMDFFQSDTPLWRVSLPPATQTDDMQAALNADSLMEWGGALHWLSTDAAAETVFNYAREKQGHATLFRRGDQNGQIFSPLPAGMLKLHQQLKHAFDPKGIFNPGRMYAEY